MVPGYTPNALYNVRVAVMTTGTWSPFSEACQITSPQSAARHIAESADEESIAALVIKAYPNPFSDAFAFNISGAEKADVRIYDISGRLLETFTASTGTREIGSRYPSGIYTVIVNGQDAQPITLRMIKR